MDVSELRCTSCLAPIDPTRGALQHCVYCGATLTLGAGAVTSGDAPAVPAVMGPGIFLEVCGPNKIDVIRCIREATGLGLKQAKDLAEGAPCAIACDVTRTKKLRDGLIAAGARVR